MSTTASIERTPTGWRVEVKDVESAVVETDGSHLIVAFEPDNDDQPLAVSLGEPA